MTPPALVSSTGRGAGIKRGIDGEDEHDASVEVFQRRLNESQAYFAFTSIAERWSRRYLR